METVVKLQTPRSRRPIVGGMDSSQHDGGDGLTGYPPSRLLLVQLVVVDVADQTQSNGFEGCRCVKGWFEYPPSGSLLSLL
jgi:hypothetical protein